MRFADAWYLYSKAKDKASGKPLGNNTRLVRVNETTLAVRLHGTNVVEIHNDGTYTLRSGGWRTATTKDRINKYSPANVSQRNWEWYVGDFVFFDGVKVDSAGRVLNADANLARR